MANEMFSSLPDVMTAEQLASALQISKSGAYALLSRPDFPTLRIGGRKMVIKKDLLEWLNSRTNRPQEKLWAMLWNINLKSRSRQSDPAPPLK